MRGLITLETTAWLYCTSDTKSDTSVVVSGVGLINEVNRHWARLVLGWVTVCGRVNHLGM